MYGLKQAAILAYEHLVKHLKTRGYYPAIGNNAIFDNKTRKTNFCLYVDYFGLKYH